MKWTRCALAQPHPATVLQTAHATHTQVKAVEEEYSNHMRHLETQLEEALLQQQQAEAAAAQAAAAAAAAANVPASSVANSLPAFDTSSAAEKTLQLLDRLLNVSLFGCESASSQHLSIGTVILVSRLFELHAVGVVILDIVVAAKSQ